MTTRNIADCVQMLQDAWTNALAQWISQYPDSSVPFLTACFRDDAEQTKDYCQGRTTPGIVITHAQAGQSAHNYNPAYAFDIAFKKADGTLDWNVALFGQFAAIITGIEPGIEWGGSWPAGVRDNPHFEVIAWTKLKPSA